MATAMNATGVSEGHFDGVLDEVRIWNYPRTLGQIRSTINSEIVGSQTGLVARWGLNEGSGTTLTSSAETVINGDITNSGWGWVPAAPFDLIINEPPDPPILKAPADGAVGIGTSPLLDVSVSDPENAPMTVTFYGRDISGGAGEDFTIIALPDTQFYSESYPATFSAQTQWIVANLVSRNIVFVTQLGDCVQNGDNFGNDSEWVIADAAFSYMENPASTFLPDGIPYGIAVGNHDQSPIGEADGTTTFFNQFFGENRFIDRSYYGGHFGSNNDNHYQSVTGKTISPDQYGRLRPKVWSVT